MKVIILAGGFGTRLQSVVHDMPKPMADIDGTPFLEILMSYMIQYGADEFILCVSYLRDKIISFFGNEYKGCPVHYSIEKEPLGTGGAVKQAFDMFHLEEALVLNGDTFVQVDYARFYRQSRGTGLSVVLKNVPDVSRFGFVETDGNYILRFCEKSKVCQKGLISAGVYYVQKSIWKYTPAQKSFSFEKDIMEKNIDHLQVRFSLAEDYFIDIGLPESYAQANRELKKIVGFQNKALFLDRDGVINIDKHHVYKIEDCEFSEGIFDLCREAKRKGYIWN